MRRLSLRHSLGFVAGFTFLAAASACGKDPGVSSSKSIKLDGSATPNGLRWEDLGAATDTATLDVPLDYSDPAAGTISLHMVRHRATNESDRIGSLLVNPGGPGFGGAFLAENASAFFGEDLVERFDIIGWDPRGTGLSEPAVDCIDSYDEYFAGDTSPDSEDAAAELVAQSKALADACAAAHPDLLAHISTSDSARDIDSIRAALGEDKISYFGFSYGSELGATWATMFPDTVRAAVLDGAVDPNQSSTDATLSQAKGFEQTLSTYLAKCSADTKCAFHNGGDAESAFDALIDAIDETPIEVSADRAAVTSGVALTAVAQAMYSDSFWPDLSRALADAQAGDGAGLLELYDLYYQRQSDGSYGNELEAFISIECLDDPGPLTVEAVEANRAAFVAAAPRFGDHFVTGYACVFWPVPPAERVTITGAGAGPIVVVGTTGDPATPLSSTEAMAAALEGGVLVVVEADQHTGYGLNDCISAAVDNYLTDLATPKDGLRC